MASRLTGQFREEFELALSQEGRDPYNEVFQTCMAVMHEHKLAVCISKCQPRPVLGTQKEQGWLGALAA